MPKTPDEKSPFETSADLINKIVAVVVGLLFLLGVGWLLADRYDKNGIERKNAQYRSDLGVETSPLTQSGDRITLSAKDDRSLPLLNGEKVDVASLINIRQPLHYGMHVWNEVGVPASGATWVRVDLATQTLSVFRGAHEIGSGVLLYGADSHPTPLGRFPIKAKLKDHKSSTYDAPMPYTLRLTDDGVSIHGSNVRRGLATHGCIGIPSDFAALIFAAVEAGDPVYIVNGEQTG